MRGRKSPHSLYERVLRGAIEGPIVRPELGPCLDFRNTLPSNRYPQIITGTRPTRIWITGNRIVLEHALGRPLGPGMFALHHCDRSSCIREDHLYEGTQKQNTRDRDERTGNPLRGFNNKGSAHAKSKLTDEDVRAIRSLATNGQRVVDISRLYTRVSRSLISRIVSRKQWAHVV